MGIIDKVKKIVKECPCVRRAREAAARRAASKK